MENEDRKEFLNIINKTAILYDAELKKEKIDIYWDIFKEYSLEEFKDAMNQAVRSCKFFPKPAEIIELMGGKLSIQDEATKEALLVINAMRQVGGHETVRFKDPVTNAVVLKGYGGWIKLCDSALEQDNKWFINEFVKIYRAYKNAGVYSTSLLPGIIDSENAKLGHHIVKQIPILISEGCLTAQKKKQIEKKKVKALP